ncbi:unnamed protein product [Merluccius merluccius]
MAQTRQDLVLRRERGPQRCLRGARMGLPLRRLMQPIPLWLSRPWWRLFPLWLTSPRLRLVPLWLTPRWLPPPLAGSSHGFASPAAESSASGSPAGPAAEPGPAALGAELGAGGVRVEGAVMAENIVCGAVADSESAGCAVAGLVSLGPDAESYGRAARTETERHDLISEIVTDMETDFKVPRCPGHKNAGGDWESGSC